MRKNIKLKNVITTDGKNKDRQEEMNNEIKTERQAQTYKESRQSTKTNNKKK